MDPSELPLNDLASLARRIRDKELSPVELVDATLRRIENLDPSLHAFITVTADEARSAAAKAEGEIARGRWSGPLHGIPVAHKDIVATAGVRTTAHSRTLADWVPTHSATAATRLEQAGAMLIGKTNTYEFACGGTETFGVPVNPWNVERTTGGSSSGSASAVAASLCFGATGTDTGGSIRGPAAYCGVVGLKPTYGRVSRAGVLPLSWSLDYVGPMTRTVLDAAVMLDALAGHDPTDPSSLDEGAPGYVDALGGLDAPEPPDIRGLRVGVPEGFDEGVDDDVRARFIAAVATLEELGAEVVDVQLADAVHSLVATFAVMCPEATLAHLERLRSRADEYSSFARQTLLLGACLSGMDYLRGQRLRHLLHREVSRVLTNVDVLAWPTTRHTAPEVARPEGWAVVHTELTNVTGHPSLTVPCGFDRDGMPIGLHLTGRMSDEATILSLASAYEHRSPWHAESPDVPTDYQPPMSKPYAFGSLVGQVDDSERDALIDEVVGRLRNAGLPVIEEDLDPLASTLRSVKAGLDAGPEATGTIEPLVHQFIGRVSTS